jgi:hypothetical protein
MRWTLAAALLAQWPCRTASTPATAPDWADGAYAGTYTLEPTPGPTPDWVDGTANSYVPGDWIHAATPAPTPFTSTPVLSILAYIGQYCNDSILLGHRGNGVTIEQCLDMAARDGRCNPDFVHIRNREPFSYCYCARAGTICSARSNDGDYDVWRRRIPHAGLRLAGVGATAQHGRLEVYYSGAWGTVCNANFTSLDAAVACRQLGYPAGWPIGVSTFGVGSGHIWMEDVSCTGNESRLQDCKTGMHNCSHEDDVGIVCAASEWTLVGNGFCRTASGSAGTYTTASNLSYVQCRDECDRAPACKAYEYRWATDTHTCELHTGDITHVDPVSYAQCWQKKQEEAPAPAPTPVAFAWPTSVTGPVPVPTPVPAPVPTPDGVDGTAASYVPGPGRASYVPGAATPAPTPYTSTPVLSILAYIGQTCNDSILLAHGGNFMTAVTIEQCLDMAASDGRCNPDFVHLRNREPFAYCYCARAGTTCSARSNNGDYDVWRRRIPHAGLRLAGVGATTQHGRLEVYYNGAWGTVCNADFTSLDATVACRQLGYPAGWPIGVSTFGVGSGHIWMEDVSCTGNESRLQECKTGVHNCSHEDDGESSAWPRSGHLLATVFAARQVVTSAHIRPPGTFHTCSAGTSAARLRPVMLTSTDGRRMLIFACCTREKLHKSTPCHMRSAGRRIWMMHPRQRPRR